MILVESFSFRTDSFLLRAVSQPSTKPNFLIQCSVSPGRGVLH